MEVMFNFVINLYTFWSVGMIFLIEKEKVWKSHSRLMNKFLSLHDCGS